MAWRHAVDYVAFALICAVILLWIQVRQRIHESDDALIEALRIERLTSPTLQVLADLADERTKEVVSQDAGPGPAQRLARRLRATIPERWRPVSPSRTASQPRPTVTDGDDDPRNDSFERPETASDGSDS